MIPLIIFLVFINTAFASERYTTADYQFRQFTIKEGLSQSSILAVMQDKSGYMWFGTANGLNRFDGYNFVNYVNIPGDSTSLSDNVITAIYQDKDGYFWIGTVMGILNKFNRKNETFEYFYPNRSSKIRKTVNDPYTSYPASFVRNNQYSITSINEDRNGNLWIGTWGNGLYRFDKDSEEFEHFYNDPDNKFSLSFNRVTKVFTDRKGIVWVATFGGGINRLVKIQDNNSVRKYYYGFIQHRSDKKNNYSLSSNYITSIAEDKNSDLWIGTFDGGLNKLNDSQKFAKASEIKFINYYTGKPNFPFRVITAIIEGEDNSLWIGTLGNGLVKFDYKTNLFLNFRYNPLIENSLPDNDVISLEIDRSGIIWIGTSLGRGISQLQVNKKKFAHLKQSPGNSNSLSDNVVWAITEDKEGYIWIGTYKGGLNRYDKEKKEIVSYRHNPSDPTSIPDNHIRSLAVDNNNNLWVGCFEGGLSMYNRKTQKFLELSKAGLTKNALGSGQILDIHIENDSVFWIAAYGGGLIKFVINSDNHIKFKRYSNDPENNSSLSDDRVYTVFEDKSGTIWVGTFGGGLNKFDKRSEKFTAFRNIPGDPFSLSDDRVIGIFEDSEEIIWTGTYGGGLCRFDRELRQFTRFSENDGLTSYVIYGILEDRHKNLWMSTNNGIYKYSRKENIFTQYDMSDGTQSLEFSGGAYYKARDGEMYFGGINGINSFYPDSIKLMTYVPNVVISSLKILNTPVKGERKELVLSHSENFFSFEFAALDYSNPEDCKYAYMLEGFDEDWRYTNAKQRVAMYTNLTPGDYTFRVIGSNSDGIWNYEGTRIKLTILPPFWQTWWFITGGILLFLLALYFVSTVRIRNLLAIEKLKTKLAADLHDNIGSGLTEISILSELVSREIHNGSENISQNLKSISETSRYLIDNMSDIVWVVNPRRDSLHDLIIRLKDSYNDVLLYKGISLRTTNLDKLQNIRLPMEYRQNLFLIFKEGINNSLKHSKCSEIILEANLRGEVLEMVLKDNGIGMQNSENIKGNGLRNMASRAKIIGGRLKWRSSTENGTAITFIGKINATNKIFYSLKKFFNLTE